MAGLTSLWDLEGHWSLSRRIQHSEGRVDRMTGTADFQRSGTQLIQDETGTLEVNKQHLEAKQRYIWTAVEDRFEVLFADHRPFHAVPMGVAKPVDEHFCAPDTYNVRYDFSAWPKWTSIWTVRGPRKDYIMTSTYAKMPSV